MESFEGGSNVLVTGGKGFVGRNLVEEFHTKAVGYDRLDTKDIQDINRLAYEMRGKDAVVHLAALISVNESMSEPARYHYTNVEGTRRVAEAAILAGCNSLLFYSSAAAKDPESSPYAQTKFQAERILQEYRDKIRVIIFRPENIYGPGQNAAYAGVITKFFESAREGKDLVVSGTGEQTRDFIYVKDIAALTKKALENRQRIHTGSIFEVGTGNPVSINQVAQYFAQKFGVGISHNPNLPVGIMHSFAHNTPLLEAINGFTFTPLEKGLDNVVHAYELDSNA